MSYSKFVCVVTLLLGLLQLQPGGTRVSTEVPKGPLYRAVGHQLSIPCHVRGINDSASWIEFEFRMQHQGTNHDIISTRDPNHGDVLFSDRVRTKTISVERRDPTSVVFTITDLKASDEGEYECAVVNQEGSYDGDYSAKIIVKVIKDTLRVSSLAPTSLSLEEGDALTLILKASSDTVQRTNLSVTWYLQPDGEKHPHPIVSLDRGLTQSPGPRFRERYGAGGVQLVKVGEDTYKLSIAKVELLDQGEVYCQAVEWIEGPDGHRNPISSKLSEKTPLKVKAKGNERASSGSGPSPGVLPGILTYLIALVLLALVW
ncbi:immunoglobulin superfamily member 2 [Gadus morhua]|uniref:immunoglobulin superfamily member 2 n=1 Tax=Gadus morhua TaxID=8049 RepID=UPI0011B42F10|nr:immunoglobulin superfamily member 2-like [Gadus morhua]